MYQYTANRRFTGNGKFAIGLLLLGAGFLLMLQRLGVEIPDWILSWPFLITLTGVLILIQSRFSKPQGFILTVIGLYFLSREVQDLSGLRRFTGPVLFIAAGFYLLLKRNTSFRKNINNPFQSKTVRDREDPAPETKSEFDTAGRASREASTDSRAFIDDTAFFGNIKKNILAKNMAGGQITAFFGGIELNFLSADIQGTAILDITQVFGSSRLIVPAGWLLISEVSAIMGSVEDKRQTNLNTDSTKTLIIKGICLFGSIQISN